MTDRKTIDNLCRLVLDDGQGITHTEDLLAAEVRRLQAESDRLRADTERSRAEAGACALREAAEDSVWCMAAVIDEGREFTREDIRSSLLARADRIERGEPHPAPTERSRIVGQDDDQ
jgi:hypothetical protein